MPDRIQRRDFLKAFQGSTVDVRKLESDPRLKAVVPSKADVDNNGVLSGEEELGKLFTQIDSFGRSPDAPSTSLVGPDGKGTQAAVAMRALGELTRNRDVLGFTEGIDLSHRTDWSLFIPPARSDGTGQGMVGGAALLVREHKNNYGTTQPWFNVDPNHALPANVSLGGLGKTAAKPEGVWKCNLFGGNALYAGGFEPPYYGNRGRGEYPNANQFFKFSDKYASQFGNKVHFKMVDELDLNGLSGDAKRERLIEVLRQAQPGDLLMVDHQGSEVSDGGHTRVVMRNDLRPDGTGEISSGQATFNDAAVRDESLSAFTGEEHVWVLRPNRPRQGPSLLPAGSTGPTPPPAPPAPPAPGGTTTAYEVKAGDTLSKIAREKLGNAARWPEIQAANPGLDPARLRVGASIKLPS